MSRRSSLELLAASCLLKQEGQHPLTGQRAANFRLLASHWAERRLVTQWRHGCRKAIDCATTLPLTLFI